MGDGCISKEKIIKLCDGHPDHQYLQDSIEFIKTYQEYLEKEFKVHAKITILKNQVELVVASKWLCRFFKFFYEFQKDIEKITKPQIIENYAELSKIFYKGMFDADSGIKIKDKFLCFKSKDEKFVKKCKKDLLDYGIFTGEIAYDNCKIPALKIYAHNLLAFAENIVFNHPRKQKILIEHLKKGCSIKQLRKVKKHNLINNTFYDLNQIQDLKIKGIAKTFKKYRQKIGTQKQVAKLLETCRGNIKRWENNNSSIPFKQYINLAELNGITIEDCLKNLKKESLFSKGALKKFVKIPIKFQKSHEKIFELLSPRKNTTCIKMYCTNHQNINKEKLISAIEKRFKVKVVKDAGSLVIHSNLLADFLNTFYEYAPSWEPITEKRILKLKQKWQVF